MAHLQIEPDMLRAGHWTVRSDNPSVLAAVSDAIVQSLGLDGEALGVWALHYDEQDMHAEDAYARERSELGIHAQVQVIALPTPARAHTVYIDRLHLVSVAAPPAVGSRIAGLYVGTAGDFVLTVHHPSVNMQAGAQLAQIPNDKTLQGGDALIPTSRFVLAYNRDQSNTLLVRAPQPLALSVQEALGRLSHVVAGW